MQEFLGDVEVSFASTYWQKPTRIIRVASNDALRSLSAGEVTQSAGSFTNYIPESPNRFIIWRAVGSNLYLEERSADHTLQGSSICITFPRAYIIPGTSLCALPGKLLIVVPTQFSIHRFFLLLPPASDASNTTWKSIFAFLPSSDQLSKCHDFYDLTAEETAVRAVAVHACNDVTSVAFCMAGGQLLLVQLSGTIRWKDVNETWLKKDNFLFRIIGHSSRMTAVSDVTACVVQGSSFFYAAYENGDIGIWTTPAVRLVKSTHISQLMGTDFNKQGEVLLSSVRMCDVGDMLFLIFLLRSESYMFAVASVDVLDGSHIEPMTMFTAPYAEIYDFKALLCDGEPSLVVLCSDSNGKSYLIINNLNIANDSEKPWRVVAGPRSRFPDSLIDEKNPREAGNTIRCFIFNPDNYSFDVVSRAVQLECGGFDGNFDQNDWVALYKHVDQYLHSPAFDERQNARLARISTAATPMEPMTIEIFWRNLLSSCDQLMESGCLPISIWHSQHLGLFGVIQENRFTVRMPQDRFMKNILTPTKTDLKDNLHSDLIGHLATCFEAVMRRQSRENVEKAANFISGPYARVHTMFEDIIRRFCKAPETDHALESSIVEIAYGGSFCAGLLASTIQRLVDDRFYFGLSLLAITTASELSSEIVLDSWRASVAIYHEALLNVTKQYRLMSQMLSLRLSESDYESTVIFAFLSQGGLSAVEGYARAQAFLEPEMEADEDVELDSPVESQVVDRNAPFVNFSERVIEAAIDLLGPQNPHLFLPRFLLTTGHFSTLSEYCQLNKPYPQKFHFAFCYFEGNVYCGLGLPYEAVRAFGSALHGIEAEDDILNSVVLEEQVPQRKISVAEYFLKVIGLLESYDYKEQLVFVGRLALSKIEAGNAFLPEIYTALFKHELNSDLYCESLQTLSANPASDCRKKCLREFLARLVERNEIKILIDSDYGQMTDQVVEILEARARTADISEDITLYELLYDFHLKRCELSKASTIMYELSWRLRSGVQTQETLRKRCCALSSVCSTLALLPIDLQWFAFQSDAREKQKGSDELVEICIDDDDVSVGSGRLPEFDDYYRKDNGKNLAIVTLGDIRKESVLATCRSVLLDTVSANELTDSSRVSFIPPLQPYDVLNLLVGRKLFSHSWTLARTFDLPPFSILEAVVTDCINFDASGSNLLPPWVAVCRKFVTGIFMGKDRHWYVVKSMLKIAMKDRPNDPEILRCVTTVFVINHWPIPFWLSELYKKQNVADFLHLLVSYGCLSNACEILIDLVDSTTRSITSNKASTILPYNVIDHLLLLSKKADDGAISSSVNELKKKLNIYFETLESFSR